MKGTPIYEMVSGAYQVTLVGAFVPLVMGLYWKRATTQGAIFSVVAGHRGTWLLFLPQSPARASRLPGAAGRPAGRLRRHGRGLAGAAGGSRNRHGAAPTTGRRLSARADAGRVAGAARVAVWARRL